MFASLKGVVEAVAAEGAVIDVHGVGYLVQASGRTLSRLSAGAAVHLLIETQVREESITLFGFLSSAEREAFRLLTSVQGVGGRLGLAILSTLAADELARSVVLEDRASIARTPGVGPRLAARIVTELKGKMGSAAPVGTAGAALAPAEPATPASDAVSALVNLGFRDADAQRAVAEVVRDMGEMELPLLIREALKRARA